MKLALYFAISTILTAILAWEFYQIVLKIEGAAK